jgi:hypothetical protein
LRTQALSARQRHVEECLSHSSDPSRLDKWVRSGSSDVQLQASRISQLDGLEARSGTKMEDDADGQSEEEQPREQLPFEDEDELDEEELLHRLSQSQHPDEDPPAQQRTDQGIGFEADRTDPPCESVAAGIEPSRLTIFAGHRSSDGLPLDAASLDAAAAAAATSLSSQIQVFDSTKLCAATICAHCHSYVHTVG